MRELEGHTEMDGADVIHPDVNSRMVDEDSNLGPLDELDNMLIDESMDQIDMLEGDDGLFDFEKLFTGSLQRQVINTALRRSSAINLRLQEFRKSVGDKVKIQERGRKLKALIEEKRFKDLIAAKKKELDEKMKMPPFLRLIDKCAFVIGIVIMCITEFFLLRSPERMYIWYTVLIIPLMALRFFMYHRLKFHYFMLDFCYLCQFLLLFYLFVHQHTMGPSVSSSLFKLVFGLSNGPLAWASVVWRNKLVFHDLDKLTSVFIHVCPPLVTYCLRWYPVGGDLGSVCGSGGCDMTARDYLMTPIYMYLFWQAGYYVKTELIDKAKLEGDKDIMTSSRWMTQKEPHPVYKWLVKRGYRGSGTTVLMACQLMYTVFTLLPLPLLFSSYWLHTAFLLFVFASVLWGGASYYFEVFTESYSKRLVIDERRKSSSRKLQSVGSSSVFFVAFFSAFYCFLYSIL